MWQVVPYFPGTILRALLIKQLEVHSQINPNSGCDSECSEIAAYYLQIQESSVNQQKSHETVNCFTTTELQSNKQNTRTQVIRQEKYKA